MPDTTTVGTIMTRHVTTVTMDDTLGRIRDVFASVRFHHLIVVDQGRVVGVLSDRDLLKHLSPFVGKFTERSQDTFTLNKRVHQIMVRRLVSCREHTLLKDAGRVMLDNNVSCLPVLDADGTCIGIVTLRDMMSWSLVRCAGDQDSCELPAAA